MKEGLTIEELAAEMMRQNEQKEDYIVDTRSLRMEQHGSMLALHVLDEASNDRIEPMEIHDLAHRQIATHLKISAKYYGRMQGSNPELLVQNVNSWFETTPSQRMLRVLDGGLRAFLSNRYLRIDHHEVSCAVIPIIGEIPNVQFLSCQITDARMYIKLANPNLQQEIAPGETVQAGLLISNSEVGLGSVSVQPMIYRPEMGTALVVRDSSLKRIHSGPVYSIEENFQLFPEEFSMENDFVFLDKVRQAIRDATDTSVFFQIIEKIRQAKGTCLNEEKLSGIVQATGSAFGITEAEQNGVLEQMMDADDKSVYGLANAVARYSANADSYDRATDLETVGYDILSIPAREWNRMNQAAA